MSRERTPHKPVAPVTSIAPFTVPAWAIVCALVVLTLIVQRHALGRFFALDDLILFQQVAGIRPWPITVWRWLSGWAWFRTVVPLWGLAPFPYHVASLTLHALNVLLLHRLARRWGASPVAAFVGAGLFAISRLHFPALLAATSIGELLSLTGLLAAFLLVAPGARIALAVLALALALSAKETVMLVPIAAVFVVMPGSPSSTWRERARALTPLLAVGAVLGLALLWSGVGSGRLGGQAYAVSFGANLFENVARLFGWTVDMMDPIPDLHATTEGLAHIVLPLLALALTVLAFRTRNASLLHAGTAWWWLAVLPVLPLPGRTYLHYLYIPLAGCSLAVAAVWEGAVALRQSRARGKRGSGRAAWVAAFVLLIVVAAWGDVLLSVRQDLRMASTDWPLDPVVRKSEIARGAIAEVRDALSGRHARVVILIPASISHDVDLGSGRVSTETPVKHYVLQEVLDEGRSLRAFVPEVDSVVFLHDYERGYDGWLCLVNSGGSHLTSVGELPAGHARFVKAMLVSGYVGPALDYAEKALVDMPGDGLLQALRAQAAAAATAPR